MALCTVASMVMGLALTWRSPATRLRAWPAPAGETARLGFLICFPLPTRIRYDIRRSVLERGAELPRDVAVDAKREPSMKSKKPTSPRARRSPASSSGRTLDEGRAVVLDFVQSRIEAFNAEQGGGVAVRKDAHGYTLLHQDSGMPIARCAPGTPATGSRCFTGAPSANAGSPSARWEGWSSPSSMRSSSSPTTRWTASGGERQAV